MAKNEYQVSPMRGVEVPWDIEHLDREILGGKVQSTQATRLELQKQRQEHVDSVGLGSFFRFKPTDAVFKVPVAFATQTSKWLQRQVEGAGKKAVVDVPVGDQHHPYVTDRMVDFWYFSSLNVKKRKVVRHATVLPSDPALIDVTETLSSMDALLQILSAAYQVEDQALVNASLAAARHLIVKGRVDPMDCVKLLEQAYTVEGVHQEHELVRKRMLLTAALCMRSAFQFPGPVKNAMTRALTCEALQEDWIEAEKWMDRKESAK